MRYDRRKACATRSAPRNAENRIRAEQMGVTKAQSGRDGGGSSQKRWHKGGEKFFIGYTCGRRRCVDGCDYVPPAATNWRSDGAQAQFQLAISNGESLSLDDYKLLSQPLQGSDGLPRISLQRLAAVKGSYRILTTGRQQHFAHGSRMSGQNGSYVQIDRDK